MIQGNWEQIINTIIIIIISIIIPNWGCVDEIANK